MNIIWSGLLAYAYPPTALLYRVTQKIRQCNCHIILIVPGWPGMPLFWDLVQLSMEIPLLLPASKTQHHNQVFHINSHYLNLHAWSLGLDSSKNKASLWKWQRSSTKTIYKSKWALFEKLCRENLVDMFTLSVKQVSDFFMYLYQDLNMRPSTIDGYRTAIVDTLGPAVLHISQSSDLNRLLSSFHRDRPKSSRNLPKWNLSVVLNELKKHPLSLQKTQTSNIFPLKCLLASFGLRQVPQRNPRLGCKQSIQFRPMGEGSPFLFLRFHSQKRSSKKMFLHCVSGDCSCFDYHCG